MATGGILSTLRIGLMECIPVLEKHQEYLVSMATRKQMQRSEASSAVDCVVKDIGDREKITIIEIGGDEKQCKEVRDIMNELFTKEFYEPVNISTMLPVNRVRRYRVLNKFLLQQTPAKLGLWTFDNHGTAPQSVFVFLVNLEDDLNTIMQKVMELRTQLLSQQRIFYPREFRQHLQYYSSSIVDTSTASMRMLLSMVLGDSRATQNAATKLVEERVLDAILSGDEELALDMRSFNGRESQYLSFLAVVRKTLADFLAEDKNRWQASYDGSIVSNLSVACSLPALFKLCVQNAMKEDPNMPIPASDKYLCRYLYPRTVAAAAAVSSTETLIPLRWAVQQKIFEKPNLDSYYNMSQYKSLKTLAVLLGNLLVNMTSSDDKSGIDIGEPEMPLVACQHPGRSWIPSELKLGEGQHSFHKFNLTPSIRLVHHLPPDIEGSFYRGKPQLTLKDAVLEPSSGPRHFTELTKSFIVNAEDKKPVTIITNDGGPDHNIHHDRNKAALLAFFLNNEHILYLANFQMAANRSAFHPVEKLNCIVNLSLNGVALARDELEDPNYEKILKGCSSMVDIRNGVKANPGLADQVAEGLKASKEIVENRVKQASLKENLFEVFESADQAEIEDFMNILKTVDPSFNVSDYLDTKKKFHLTGLLLEYFKDVATESYYCITMTKHRNMTSEFLNSLYPDLNLPFDLHPIPCPVKDKENPDKFLKFEDLYHSSSLRSYDDYQRPGRTEKKLHNIPFTKSLVRAHYCSEISMICAGCGKRRVIYCKYKPTASKIKQARNLFENMRYECGSSLCSFGTEGVATVAEAMTEHAGDDAGETMFDRDVDNNEAQDNPDSRENGAVSREIELLGNDSIFSTFFMDASLCCSTPMEKHLYEILAPSVTSSPPCYYCGETDLVRTSVESDFTYPLCLFCKTVKKFGFVSKRKKRTIAPPKQKKKNKRKKNATATTFIEFSDEDNDELVEAEEALADKDMSQDSDDHSEDWEEHAMQSEKGDSEDSGEMDSLPPSPTMYTPVEELLDGD